MFWQRTSVYRGVIFRQNISWLFWSAYLIYFHLVILNTNVVLTSKLCLSCTKIWICGVAVTIFSTNVVISFICVPDGRTMILFVQSTMQKWQEWMLLLQNPKAARNSRIGSLRSSHRSLYLYFTAVCSSISHLLKPNLRISITQSRERRTCFVLHMDAYLLHS